MLPGVRYSARCSELPTGLDFCLTGGLRAYDTRRRKRFCFSLICSSLAVQFAYIAIDEYF